ncbi:MAG: protein kinase [Bacteroidia bacterium]|nr:protein kinase [Bacteroidia bacterium]
MSQLKPKIPVIFLAFANERSQDGFLRKLTTELKHIMNALEPAVQTGRCQLKILPAATQEEIAAVFQDEWYQDRIWIFHYGGHADEDELWLETESGNNQSFFSMGLARFLGAQEGLKLVFLNGCATGDHARLLLAEKIPAVIGTSRKILDDQALQFSETFYKGLAGGASIQEAFQEAEGILLGTHGNAAFGKRDGHRSLFWEEEPQVETPDLPWRLFLQENASWFPAQWRLFHEFKEPEKQEEIKEEAFVGEEFNNYRITEFLGNGTLGAVFKAVHTEMNEERAIKITHNVLKGYDLVKSALVAGSKGLASIKHANVMDLYDVGEVTLYGQKRLYLVMEIVKGERLDKTDHTKYREDHHLFTELALQLAAGLEAAHKTNFEDETGTPREGIIHGNLKTRKILFDIKGIPKITDFMFTDLSRSQNIVFDIPEVVQIRDRAERLDDYFAPEVIQGFSSVNRQTDIYSLGAIFFEILTGRSIADFDFQTVDDLHRFLKTTTNNFPRSISKTIFRSVQEQPADRYREVSEMIAELLAPTSWLKKIKYWFRRK